MSFDKSYPHRKDIRAPYRGSKRFDASCRPNGGCPWCQRNRTFNDLKRAESAKDRERQGVHGD